MALLAVGALVPGQGAARARDLDALRDYYAGRGDTQALRKRLTRLGVGRLLRLLVHVEPHVTQARAMQRFDTPAGDYYVIPPASYSPKRSWPLHIALHGHGSSQTGRVACQTYWKGEPARHGVILACPDRRGKWNTRGGEEHILATYRDVQQRFNVRTDKVSLGGFSGGGIGAWIIGPRYPDLFSALVPRAGIPPRADDVIENLNGLPMFVIHGHNDPVIGVEHSRRIRDALQRLKIDHVYREPVGGHEFFGKLNDEVVRWLKSKTRRLRTRFRYHGPLGGEARIVHWLQLTGSGRVTVEGAIHKRRKIVIDVDDLSRLKQIDIHLNRKIFDVNRRGADVILNGRPMRFEVRETAEHVLDSYAITRDLRRVFTSKITLKAKHLRGARTKRGR